MKTRLWILLGIIILASFLRLWQLGTVPPSPDWDEAALGYNAYSIRETGRDEYGKFLPIILRSFDDYKPALYTYLVIPTMTIFGLNTFAVRLPSALFGIATVLAVYFLVDELIRRKKHPSFFDNMVPLLSAFFLAISPWHLQFSRIAFESNVGLSLNVFGTLFFIKALKRPWLLLLSVSSFAASLYVYQSEKVFTPLLVVVLLCLFWREVWRLPRRYVYGAVILGLIVVFPMVFVTLTDKQALARARGVSVFSDTTQLLEKNVQRYAVSKRQHDVLGILLNNRRIIFIQTVIANYLSHFNFNWLFISGDIARHHAPNMGLLYLFEFPLILIGIYQLILGEWDKKMKWLFGLWFLLAAVPASITSGVPHAVRTLNFLPVYPLLSALGASTVLSLSKWKRGKEIFQKDTLINVVTLGYVLFAIVNIGYYADQYFVQQNIENAKEWQYGYEQAIQIIKPIASHYDKIVVSNQPYLDQSYMFFLYYLQYSPRVYQKEVLLSSGGFRENHHFGNYEFRPILWDKEPTGKTLYVGRPQDFSSPYKEIGSVDFLNGEKAILIVEK